MMDEAVEGSFKGLYVQGEDIAQSDPDTQHITAGLRAMECVIIQDLFLNETARYAHVFLPGASFLEKDGTFTNAERRISRVRKAMAPLAGMADWEATIAFAHALGMPMNYSHPSQIMDEIAALDADFHGRLLRQARRTGLDPVAVQRRRADRHADHARRSLRARQGPVHADRICPDRRAHRPAVPVAADDGSHPLAI